MEERYEIKVRELMEATCKIEYEDKLNHIWEEVVGRGWRHSTWRG